MKTNILLVLAITVLHCNLFAQAEKGDVLLGTQFSYFSNKTNSNSDYNEYLLFPSVAIYFSPKFNMGLGVEFFGYDEQEEISTPNGGSEIIDTEFRLRTYSVIANAHSKLTERLYFNVGFNLGIGRGSVNYDNDFTSKISSLGFSIRPGLFYFASKALVLTANIGQLSVGTSEESVDDSNNLPFNPRPVTSERVRVGLGFQSINFGVSFLID